MKRKFVLLLAGCLILTSCTRNEANNRIESSINSESSNEESNHEISQEEQQSASKDENASNSALESIPSISSSSTETHSDSTPSANVPELQSSEGRSNIPEQQQNFIIIAPESSSIPTETNHDDIGFLTNVEKEIIRLMNDQRKSLGLNKLVSDEKLRDASRIRSKELYNNGFIMHKRPDGRKWETVLQYDIPLKFKSAGENLANVEHNMPNYDPSFDADYWYTTWKNSPGHYENIIRSRFTHVGVGVYYIKKDKMIYAYATTLFAEI